MSSALAIVHEPGRFVTPIDGAEAAALRPLAPAVAGCHAGSMVAGDWVVEIAPAPADIAVLEERLYEFNVARTGIADAVLLALFVRDPGGTIAAGIYGWTWGACCEIRYLWVRADLRGQGVGSRLLAAAEDEALRRGSRQIVLDTHSFQAPGFYGKLGYEIYAVLPDYPRGHKRIHLHKRLGETLGRR